MNHFIETLNLHGAQAARFAWPMFWQSSLLIGVLFALDFALRRKLRAAVRYALWLVVLLKLLAPPSLALPTGLAWWLRPSLPVVAVSQDRAVVVRYVEGPVLAPEPQTPTIAPRGNEKIWLSPSGWRLLVGSGISLAMIGWLIARWGQVARQARRAAQPSVHLLGLLHASRREAGVRRAVGLRIMEQAMSPAIWGLLRPVILLPRMLARQVPPAQLRAVLLHELFHVRRGDAWVNCGQTLLQILYWWHPLVWLANARMRALREEAVDDAVMLALREEAETYAPTLLEVAKLVLARPLATLGLVGVLDSQCALKRRIERLLNFRAPRRAGLTFVSLFGVLAFTVLAVPMGQAPARPADTSVSLQTGTLGWPDIRFAGYQRVALEAQFLKVDQGSLRAALPSLTDLSRPLVLSSNELKVLTVRLHQAGAQAYSQSPLPAFSKFSGGQFRWQVGGAATNDTLYWRTRGPGDATVVGAEAELAASPPSWMPFSLTLIPWTESYGLRCQLELIPASDTNTTQRAQVTIPLSGGLVWVVAGEDSLGRRELVLLQEQGSDLEQHSVEPPAAEAPPAPVSPNRLDRPQPLKPTALVQDGKLLFELGKLDEAEAKFTQLLTQEPQNPAAHYYLHAIRDARFKSRTNVSKNGTNGVQYIPLARLPGTDSPRLAVRIIKVDPNAFLQAIQDASVLQFLRGVEPDITNPKTDPGNDGVTKPISNAIQAKVRDFFASLGIDLTTPPRSLFFNDREGALVVRATLSELERIEAAISVLNVSPRTAKRADQATNTSAAVTSAASPVAAGAADPWRQPYLNEAHSFGTNLNDPASNKLPVLGDLPLIGRLFRTDASESQSNSTGGRAIAAKSDGAGTRPQVNLKVRFVIIPTEDRRALGFDWYLGNFLFGNAFLSQTPNNPRGAPDSFASGLVPNADGTSSGVLTDPQFRVVLRALEQRQGADLMNTMSVTTLSDRQTQLQVTDATTVITGINPEALVLPGVRASNGVPAKVLLSDPRQFGPVLDVVPTIAPDNQSIELRVGAVVTELLGYGEPDGQPVQAFVDGKPTKVKLPLPRIRLRVVDTTKATVLDGETLVLVNPKSKTIGPDGTALAIQEAEKKTLLIFITPTLTDASGNRLHGESGSPPPNRR